MKKNHIIALALLVQFLTAQAQSPSPIYKDNPKTDRLITFRTYDSVTYVNRWDDTAFVLDKNGDTIANLTCRTIEDHLGDTYVVMIQKGYVRELYKHRIREIEKFRYGLKDKYNHELTSMNYKYIGWFSEGLVVAVKRRKAGYLDINGNVVIPFKYREAESFSNGLAKVKKGRRYGYIDHTGKTVIPFKRYQATDFKK